MPNQKATAEAPSNLAFIKYWGKKDSALRIPTNNSISMNLSNAKTITSVQFDPALTEDRVAFRGSDQVPDTGYVDRVSRHLDRVRELAGVSTRAFVTTENTFPESVGIASSASGFAALSVAAASALRLDLSERELSILARIGSGSACRSIPSGFVEWEAGFDHQTSYAKQIAPTDHWQISVVTVIVTEESKKITSTVGHQLATASPFFKTRLETLDERLNIVRRAILDKDFERFGREIESEAISLHMIAMTSSFGEKAWNSGAYYWTPETMELILAVQEWRAKGIETYFTLDAGPTVHLLCRREEEALILAAVRDLEQAKTGRSWESLINHPADGARVISKE
jgi:diphosphomevalonate decarboxylase